MAYPLQSEPFPAPPVAVPPRDRPPVRGSPPAWLVLALVFLGSACGACAQSISKEYQLKAAFLYNFTKFVEWPSERFAAPDSPLVIVVLGKNPFGEELEKLVKNRTVNDRAIVVRHLESAAEVADAHIVFISGAEDARLNAAVLSSPGLLTVGESTGFAAAGGVIRFILVDEKVRFEINQASGEKAGLKLSGQLLKLAASIRKTP